MWLLVKELKRFIDRYKGDALRYLAPIVESYAVDFPIAVLIVKHSDGKNEKFYICRFTDDPEKIEERVKFVEGMAKKEKAIRNDLAAAKLSLLGIKGITIIPWHPHIPIVDVSFPSKDKAKEIVKLFEGETGKEQKTDKS